MDEGAIVRLLHYDFSKGTEKFKRDLLVRILSAPPVSARIEPLDFSMVLSDSEMDMLSAAGDHYASRIDRDV